MPTPRLELETTAYTFDQLMHQDSPQLALAGRSNVGKSSLVNALAQRRKLAKVSSTPGKTRSINYYKVSPWGFYLVDLPGYGYARANHAEREKWGKLLERYLRDCPSLKGLVLLLDSRLPPQTLDINLVEYAQGIGLAIIPVLTKADKCRQRELNARIAEWTKLTRKKPVVTSSSQRRGMVALWNTMLEHMGITDKVGLADGEVADKNNRKLPEAAPAGEKTVAESTPAQADTAGTDGISSQHQSESDTRPARPRPARRPLSHPVQIAMPETEPDDDDVDGDLDDCKA